MPMLRGTLLYLAFPGYFLPIISSADKKAIRNAYSYRLDHDPGDLDRDLYEITLSIQDDVGRFHFYNHPYIDEWRLKAEEYTEKRAWLIRPRPGGADLVKRWMSENCVTVLADHLGSIEPGAGAGTAHLYRRGRRHRAHRAGPPAPCQHVHRGLGGRYVC